MKFELRPARPADVEAIMQVMADAMANLQHPEWFVPDDAVYMAEHISGPKGFCLVAEEKTTGALAAYFTVKLAGTAPDALGWQLGMSKEELNTTAIKALEGVDVAAFLLDASEPLGTGDEWVVAQLANAKNTPKILVISKSATASEKEIAAQIEAASALARWDEIVVTSALEEENVEAFVDAVVNYLPEGPLWFPADMETDQPQEVIVAEFIREKILFTVYDEVPHAIGVVVEEMGYNRRKHLTRIYATIYVERDSQKGILVGKGGATIKHIGTEARKDLEVLLGTKVYLDLQVKVKKNWRRDINQIRRFGYGEGI